MENNQQMINISKQIESLGLQIDQIKKEINRLKIDEGRYIPKERSITPGIAAKIAYDSNGLVLKGSKLDVSDIPTLPISHIDGLKSTLDNVMSSADVKKITSEIKESMIRRSNNSIATATKVNYDANGFVVSGSNLTADDIPSLPMDKITGLVDIIRIMDDMSKAQSKVSNDPTTREAFKSGTFTKVNVDSLGRVINGDRLTTDDIPIDLINRLVRLENLSVGFAPLQLVEKISKSMMSKIDSNSATHAGTFAKVSVDSNGLVTGGGNLTVDDLPELTIDMISGLKASLNKCASYEDIANLNDGMSKIMGSIQSISDINQVKATLQSKADADDVVKLRKDFDQFRSSVMRTEETFPAELVIKRLDMIDNSLSVLEGRLSVLEKEIEIN